VSSELREQMADLYERLVLDTSEEIVRKGRGETEVQSDSVDLGRENL